MEEEDTKWEKKKRRTEDDVGTIQPGCDDGGDEKLGTVGVLAGISHGEQARLAVLQLEVLVYRFGHH